MAMTKVNKDRKDDKEIEEPIPDASVQAFRALLKSSRAVSLPSQPFANKVV